MNKAARNPLTVLLVESDGMLRRTVAMTARALNYCEIHEASSCEKATRMLEIRDFHALLLSWPDGGAANGLTAQVRAGQTKCDSGTPIAVITEKCDATMLDTLKGLGVVQILVRPLRARNILDAIELLGRNAPLKSAA